MKLSKVAAATLLATAAADDFPACAAKHGLEVEYPSDDRYDEDIKNWNIRRIYRPAALVKPKDNNELIETINCARAAELKVTARSGGHSYEGYASGGQDGSVMVDLRNFDDLAIDEERELVTVGAGIRLGKLYFHLYNQANQWFPPGLCPTLGVTGFTLGGGVGFWSRKWGVASDHLAGAEVALSDGRIINATADENADLLWALRGSGGGNFGIVTKLHLHTAHAPDKVRITVLTWPHNETSNVVCYFSDLADDMNRPEVDENEDARDLGWQVIVHPDRTEAWLTLLNPTGVKTATLEGYLSGLPTPVKESRQELPFLHAYLNVSDRLHIVEDTDDLDFSQEVKIRHAYAKKKSLILNSDNKLPREACDLIEQLSDIENEPDASISMEYMGGATRDLQPDATAFAHRDMSIILGIFSIQERPFSDKLTKWLQDSWNRLQTYAAQESYQNYVDSDLKDWPQRFYKHNLLDLIKIRQKYDPTKMFDFPQGLSRLDIKHKDDGTEIYIHHKHQEIEADGDGDTDTHHEDRETKNESTEDAERETEEGTSTEKEANHL